MRIETKASFCLGLRVGLEVEFVSVCGVLHDEREAGRDVFAHKLGDGSFGVEALVIRDGDEEEAPLAGLKGCVSEGFWHHLTEPLEALDVDAGFGVFTENA